MKLGVTLDILNQKGTPAFFADTLANRPAAGFTGRIFVSTDTLDLYRDTGTTWVLLSPSSTGTITGSGAAGQVTYFSAASSITGSNDLFFDSVNGHLGIGTITPSTALTIFHDQNQIIQINQTTATNDTKIAFQNSGTPLWRIGNSYNAGANDYAIYDVVGAIQPLTIKKTTGQTFIGAETTSSGKLVVNQTAADNGLVVLGASTPSIRVRNAGTAPTQQFGLGLATGVNNFIQGAASGDFCLFNGSTTASPILFGVYDAVAVSVQEAARISSARNLLVGTSVDTGYKFDVNGAGRFTGVLYADNTIRVGNAIIGTNSNNLLLSSNTTGGEISFWNGQLANRLMTLTGAGLLGLGTSTPSVAIEVAGNSNLSTRYRASKSGSGTIEMGADRDTTNSPYISAFTNSNLDFFTNDTFRLRITNTGNLLIGTTTDAGQKLQVSGTATIKSGNGDQLLLNNSGERFTQINFSNNTVSKANIWWDNTNTELVLLAASSGVGTLRLKNSGVINIPSIPTSAAGLVSGDVYSNLGILTIVP
jgi:hypothetical protein